MAQYSAFALLEDGTVKTWGYNSVGQLGQGDTKDRTTPTVVGALSPDDIFHYFYLHNSEAYTQQNTALSKVSDDFSALSAAEKAALFDTAPQALSPVNLLNTLDAFKILRYSSKSGATAYSVTALPKYSKLIPNKLLSIGGAGIKSASLVAQGVCRVYATTDLSAYKSFDFTARIWTDDEMGINAVDLPKIMSNEWNDLLQGGAQIAFAFALDMDAISDAAEFGELTLTTYGSSSLEMALLGVDYRYGYPANNVLRVSLLADGITKSIMRDRRLLRRALILCLKIGEWMLCRDVEK